MAQKKCDSCAGSGRVVSGNHDGICLVCNGKGWVNVPEKKQGGSSSGSSGCMVLLPLVGGTMLLTAMAVSYIV